MRFKKLLEKQRDVYRSSRLGNKSRFCIKPIRVVQLDIAPCQSCIAGDHNASNPVDISGHRNVPLLKLLVSYLHYVLKVVIKWPAWETVHYKIYPRNGSGGIGRHTSASGNDNVALIKDFVWME